MTTLTELIAQCRNLIGDTSISPTFDDGTLTDFINRGIADLNAHFPRRAVYTASTTAGVRAYTLLNSHQQVLSVEYPAGQDPPRYLQRMLCTDPAFYASGDHYDFLPSNDAGSLNKPRLPISARPAGGETISVQVAAEHNPLASPGDVTSLPERLLHLVGLVVRWKTWESLASREGMDPNPLRLLAGTQQLNAGRAESAYRAALAAALAAFSESSLAPWQISHQERIY